MHVVRHTWIHIYDSVHSYSCGRAHLGMPIVISKIKSAIHQDWIELWYCFFFYMWVVIHRKSKLIQSFQADSDSDSYHSVCQSDYLILSQKVTSELLNLLTLFFARQFSIMIKTWINFGHWWVLAFFAGVPWSQACFGQNSFCKFNVLLFWQYIMN